MSKITQDDYDMIAWELQQVCSFLGEIGLDDDDVNDKVIYGTDEQRDKAILKIVNTLHEW